MHTAHTVFVFRFQFSSLRIHSLVTFSRITYRPTTIAIRHFVPYAILLESVMTQKEILISLFVNKQQTSVTWDERMKSEEREKKTALTHFPQVV